ncbi:MAG: metal-dependent hydrolase [Firmicutes bacterium]|nr:metal-dependent hydrolase [Bacillota bacterium]
MNIEFLGQSCFLIKAGPHSLLTDPFLTGNPLAAKKPEEVHPTHILVSHAHNDHLGDTKAIAKANGAKVYSTFDICQSLQAEGISFEGGNIGGKIPADFGSVKLVPAIHSSGVPGGIACGFVINIAGKNIYFAGDTALFGDMALLAKENIDIALLPIGDYFTMGPEDAAEAVRLIKPKHVIPMHYNTFPPITQDPQQFKKLVESKTDAKVTILDPGDGASF